MGVASDSYSFAYCAAWAGGADEAIEQVEASASASNGPLVPSLPASIFPSLGRRDPPSTGAEKERRPRDFLTREAARLLQAL